MKANDLRIGNYINYCNENVIVLSLIALNRRLWDVELGYFTDSIGFERSFDDENINPIPLTEEWLLKFGFKLDEDYGNWHLSDYDIYSIKKDYYRKAVCGIKEGVVVWYFGASDDYYSWTQKLEFVHQLQNLYFVLTNEELEHQIT